VPYDILSETSALNFPEANLLVPTDSTVSKCPRPSNGRDGSASPVPNGAYGESNGAQAVGVSCNEAKKAPVTSFSFFAF